MAISAMTVVVGSGTAGLVGGSSMCVACDVAAASCVAAVE